MKFVWPVTVPFTNKLQHYNINNYSNNNYPLIRFILTGTKLFLNLFVCILGSLYLRPLGSKLKLAFKGWLLSCIIFFYNFSSLSLYMFSLLSRSYLLFLVSFVHSLLGLSRSCLKRFVVNP